MTTANCEPTAKRKEHKVSYVNDPTTTFLNALSATAGEAVSGGLQLRLELKGGEVVEGVPQAWKGDASNRRGFGYEPPPEQRHLYVDRVKVSIAIAGTEVLLHGGRCVHAPAPLARWAVRIADLLSLPWVVSPSRKWRAESAEREHGEGDDGFL